MSKHLCAVVVTYNRKTLLKRCLTALQQQTYPPDKIVVVDNASTDHTVEMLKAEFPQIELLELGENLGGAGGFYEGIKYAYDQGFDWISAMDDDGYPDKECLQRLLACRDTTLLVRGPLVLDEENSENLAFKRFWKTRAEAEKASEAGFIYNYINPFNGLLISRKIIQQIGLPEKGLFLWGDEYEYFLRMKQAGVKLATMTDAHFYHPPDRMQPDDIHLFLKKIPVYYANNPLKDYLILRNHAYILKKYRGWLGWMVHVVRYLLFYWKRSGFKELPRVISASFHGARSDFSHHQKLLK